MTFTSVNFIFFLQIEFEDCMCVKQFFFVEKFMASFMLTIGHKKPTIGKHRLKHETSFVDYYLLAC
jgi:hypothetical protein